MLLLDRDSRKATEPAYAEQIGAGESLGNFPQASTHLTLISAAVNLDRALNYR